MSAYSLEIEGLVKRKYELEAEIERLRAAGKKDASYVGGLEFALNEIVAAAEDDWAVQIARNALEQARKG